MTIIIEAPQNDEMGMRESKLHVDPKELVLDGGFVVPEANAFGQTFRDYEAESERQKTVEEFYRINHINQSVEFVKRMREEYGKLSRGEMSIWECCELLNEFVDESDPDLDEPQIEHLLQTAEAIRRDYPDEDWLHLTGLIHDLGKVLLHPSFGQLPQWAVVGDTFPVGCAYDESNVHRKFFEGNADYYNPEYNTKCGIYSEGCGLDNVLMSWGHDDYMYLVAKENKTTLPSAGLFIIRYHSFYPLHKYGAYQHLMNEEDKENLKWLHIFNKYDLYSKSKVRIDVEKVKPYYLSLIEKVAFAYNNKGPYLGVKGEIEIWYPRVMENERSFSLVGCGKADGSQNLVPNQLSISMLAGWGVSDKNKEARIFVGYVVNRYTRPSEAKQHENQANRSKSGQYRTITNQIKAPTLFITNIKPNKPKDHHYRDKNQE